MCRGAAGCDDAGFRSQEVRALVAEQIQDHLPANGIQSACVRSFNRGEEVLDFNILESGSLYTEWVKFEPGKLAKMPSNRSFTIQGVQYSLPDGVVLPLVFYGSDLSPEQAKVFNAFVTAAFFSDVKGCVARSDLKLD